MTGVQTCALPIYFCASSRTKANPFAPFSALPVTAIKAVRTDSNSTTAVKGTIYFPKEKKRGKIKIKGKIIKIQERISYWSGKYSTITLETLDGKKKFNYFGKRIILIGEHITGEGMFFNKNCMSLKKFRKTKKVKQNGE